MPVKKTVAIPTADALVKSARARKSTSKAPVDKPRSTAKGPLPGGPLHESDLKTSAKIVSAKRALITAPEILLPKLAVDKGTAFANDLLGTTLQAMTTDFFILRGQHVRGTKKHPLPPVDWEIHGNILGGAVILVAGGIFLYLADIRVGPYAERRFYLHWRWRRTVPQISGQAPAGGVGRANVWGTAYEIDSAPFDMSEDDYNNNPPKSPGPHDFPEISHTSVTPEQGYWSGGSASGGTSEYKGPGGWSPGGVWVVTREGGTEKIIDAPAETVEPELITDRILSMKRWGIHERYHKQDETVASTIANNPMWVVSPLAAALGIKFPKLF